MLSSKLISFSPLLLEVISRLFDKLSAWEVNYFNTAGLTAVVWKWPWCTEEEFSRSHIKKNLPGWNIKVTQKIRLTFGYITCFLFFFLTQNLKNTPKEMQILRKQSCYTCDKYSQISPRFIFMMLKCFLSPLIKYPHSQSV